MKKIRASLAGIYENLKELDETIYQMPTLCDVFTAHYRVTHEQADKFFKAAQNAGAVVEAGRLYGVQRYRLIHDFTRDI
jgi:hypothetical protein